MVRPVVAYENLKFYRSMLQSILISTVTNFFFQSNSEVKCALRVTVSISVAILNFSDVHDNFCEACGKAGVVDECLKLLRGLKMCTHDLSDKWVSPSVTERMQMTSQTPCLCTRQNSDMVMVAMYFGKVITSPRGVICIASVFRLKEKCRLYK